MTSPRFEAFLARLYTDESARRSFAAGPKEEAARAGLSPEEAGALAHIDLTGLGFAARSFEKKRASKRRPALWRRLLAACGLD